MGVGKTTKENKKIKIPLIGYLGDFSNELLKSGIITETQKNQIQSHLLAKGLENKLFNAEVVFNEIQEQKLKNPPKAKQ